MANGGNWDAKAAQAEHIGPTDTGDNIEAKRVAGYVWNGTSWERDKGDSVAMATRLDSSADPILYVGKSPVGSATSDPVWQIAKLDTSAGLIKTFAGNAGFTQVWDDRVGLTYQ